MSGSLTPAQLDFKPDPEEWSIVEVMSHITSSNVGCCRTILALATGKDVAREGAAKQVVSAEDDLPALVAANRAHVFRSIRELPENLELEPTYPHPMFGPLNCKAWLLFIRLHNLDHASQIRKNQEHEAFPR